MTRKSPITHDYIGINEHNECVSICVDDPADPKWVAGIVGGWIKQGRTVQRLPHEDACARMKADHPKWRARREAEAGARLI